MRRHEVFQYVKTFTEVGLDWQLDCSTGCICHKSSHTGKLFNLLIRTTGSGIRHHEDIVVLIQSGEKCMCQLLIRLFPCLYDFLVTLFLCDKTTLILLCNAVYGILGVLDHLRLFRRLGHIGNGYGHCRPGGVFVTHRLNSIQHLGSSGCAVNIDDFLKDLLILLLCYEEIDLEL